MSARRVAMPRKRWLVAALVVFLVTSMTAIFLNSFLMGHGWSTERSVSRYVGFEIWSSMIFAVGNLFAAGVTGAFLWKLGGLWKMPRIYYYCVMLMVLGLIWLSLCPIGLCDPGDGRKSIVSFAHEVSSRTMFLMMMAAAGMIALRSYATDVSRILCGGYVVYGAFCILGYLTHSHWFEARVLIFETVYIAGFVILLLVLKDRRLVKQD